MVTNFVPVVNGGRIGNAWAEMDRLFDRVFAGSAAPTGSWPVPVAVWEDEDRAYIELELPGVAKEDLSIVVEKGLLSVSAERRVPEPERRFWRNERRYGSFVRSFQLPETIDVEGIQADLTNGVLTLTLHKRPEAQPRKIEIKTA